MVQLWLRTDFKEEGKWKKQMAYQLAREAQEFVKETTETLIWMNEAEMAIWGKDNCLNSYECFYDDADDVYLDDVEYASIVPMSKLFSLPPLPPEKPSRIRLKHALEKPRQHMSKYDANENRKFYHL